MTFSQSFVAGSFPAGFCVGAIAAHCPVFSMSCREDADIFSGILDNRPGLGIVAPKLLNQKVGVKSDAFATGFQSKRVDKPLFLKMPKQLMGKYGNFSKGPWKTFSEVREPANPIAKTARIK